MENERRQVAGLVMHPTELEWNRTICSENPLLFALLSCHDGIRCVCTASHADTGSSGLIAAKHVYGCCNLWNCTERRWKSVGLYKQYPSA